MKKAFTIIELIFVVILVGIMSAVVVSYFKDDNLALAAHQVVNHIRYTQHLAISEHKFDPKDATYNNAGFTGNNGTYYRAWWQIRFRVIAPTNAAAGLVGYSVYSDNDRKGNIDVAANNHKEPAINPADGLYLHLLAGNSTCSSDVNLLAKYNITNISFSQGCQAVGFTSVTQDVGAIVFDEKGRPYYGIANNAQNNPYQYRLTTNCDITLTGEDGRVAVITVTPETGYTEITSIN